MRKRAAGLLAIVMTLGTILSGCGGSSSSTTAAPAGGAAEQKTEAAGGFPTVTYNLSHPSSTSDDDIQNYAAVKFAEHVSEMTDGAVTIQVLGNGQLGNGTDTTSALQMGTLAFNLDSTNVYGAQYPDVTFCDLPYLFDNAETALEFARSDVMKDVWSGMEQSCNVKILDFIDGGFRCTATNKAPIYGPDGFKGLKLRVPEVESFVKTFTALGAACTPMAWAEVYTGMSQGTVDALEAPIASLNSGNFGTVAKYVCEDNHFFNLIALQCSEKIWNEMTPELQEVVVKAAQMASEEQLKFALDNDSRFKEELAAQGAEIIGSEQIDIPALRAACEPVYEETKAKVGDALYNGAMDWINTH